MMDQDRQPLRVAFHTLGCRLNQFDTEAIKTALRAARRVQVVGWQEEADLYLLNSCTVTHRADQECRRLARQIKRRHPLARVVVAGCYAQTQPAALADVAEIDAILGNTTKQDVARWLPRVLAETDAEQAEQVVMVEAFPRRSGFDAPPIDDFPGRSRAFVKIQDGCDLRCSYCLIWKARGPGRSCPPAEVLSQVGRLHRRSGYGELVLTGVHLGRWGRDLPGQPRLVDLLQAVLGSFPDIRVRLSSIHPDDVTADLLDLLLAVPRLRPHLHLSLQSGSDGVLRRMHRPYGREEVDEALRRVTAAAPDIGLGADVIVGFPGETDAEFDATMDLVTRHPFSYLHVFRYSPRPGTAAAAMTSVPPEVVGDRAERLRSLAAAKRRAFLERLVGQTREAVVEDRVESQRQYRHATTDNYATIAVVSDLPAGTLVEVTIDTLDAAGLSARVTRVLPEVTP